MIRARLKTGREQFQLDVDLTVPRGVTALYGPSGSGKSTVIHLLLGLERAEVAEIRWEEELLERTPGGPRLPPERRRFGAVFQDDLLFPHLSVEHNVRFGLARRADPEALAAVERWIRILDLGDLRHRLPRSLSGGERQRVALARALAPRPRALFLDEPLRGLDTGLRRRALLALRRMRRELDLPVIYVSHQPAEVLAIADRLIRLERGRVTGTGDPVQLLAEAGGVGTEEPLNFLDTRVLVAGEGTGVVAWGGFRLRAPVQAKGQGEELTLTLHPSDVLLAVGETGRVSARNRLVMTVAGVIEAGPRAWVRLEAPDPFFALLTVESCRELDLGPGRQVTALVKAEAFG